MRRGVWVVSCAVVMVGACSRGPAEESPPTPTVLTDSQVQGLGRGRGGGDDAGAHRAGAG